MPMFEALLRRETKPLVAALVGVLLAMAVGVAGTLFVVEVARAGSGIACREPPTTGPQPGEDDASPIDPIASRPSSAQK